MGTIVFALATLVPAVFLGLSAAAGGLWPLLTIASIWAFKSAQAPLAVFATPDNDPDIDFPASPELGTILAVLHVFLLAVVLWSIGSGPWLGPLDRLTLLIAAALYFAQISHPNALELVHSPDRSFVWTGRAVFSSLFYGPFASAYPLVHDIHAATDDDPYSAPAGESFYTYALRATRQSFRAGLAAENEHLAGARGRARLMHPYLGYALVSAATLLATLLLAGFGGLVALVLIALLTQAQMLLRYYIRFYGLRRARQPDGAPEPLGPQHRWSLRSRFSKALTLFSLRLAAQDETVNERITELLTEESRSQNLPRAPLVMAALALVPAKWFETITPDLAPHLPDQPQHDPFTKLKSQDDIMARVMQAQQTASETPRPNRPAKPARPIVAGE